MISAFMSAFFPTTRIAVFKHDSIQFESRTYLERLVARIFYKEQARENLARVYQHLLKTCVQMHPEKDEDDAARRVTYAWDKVYAHGVRTFRKDNPSSAYDNAFVKYFVDGRLISQDFYLKVVAELASSTSAVHVWGKAVKVHFNEASYYGVGPGMSLIGSFSKTHRLYHDNCEGGAIERIQADLNAAAKIRSLKDRKLKVMAILSGAAYRDIGGKTLKVPSLVQEDNAKLIRCQCEIQKIWKGIFAFKVVPKDVREKKLERSLFVFQGTTAYPSHDGWLAKLMADVHPDGVGKGAFEKDKDKIRVILRSLNQGRSSKAKPIIAGHSLGAAMTRYTWHAMSKQIDSAYMFNIPGMEPSTEENEKKLSEVQLQKGHIYCNIDDMVPWDVGTAVSKNTNLVIGVTRWRVRGHNLLDFLIFPWIFRMAMNYSARIASHNTMMVLKKAYITVPIDAKTENRDRKKRYMFNLFKRLRAPIESFLQRWHDRIERQEIERLRNG